MHFVVMKNSRKIFSFCDLLIFKTVRFQQLKGLQRSKLDICERDTICHMKKVPFFKKDGI